MAEAGADRDTIKIGRLTQAVDTDGNTQHQIRNLLQDHQLDILILQQEDTLGNHLGIDGFECHSAKSGNNRNVVYIRSGLNCSVGCWDQLLSTELLTPTPIMVSTTDLARHGKRKKFLLQIEFMSMALGQNVDKLFVSVEPLASEFPPKVQQIMDRLHNKKKHQMRFLDEESTDSYYISTNVQEIRYQNSRVGAIDNSLSIYTIPMAVNTPNQPMIVQPSDDGENFTNGFRVAPWIVTQRDAGKYYVCRVVWSLLKQPNLKGMRFPSNARVCNQGFNQVAATVVMNPAEDPHEKLNDLVETLERLKDYAPFDSSCILFATSAVEDIWCPGAYDVRLSSVFEKYIRSFVVNVDRDFHLFLTNNDRMTYNLKKYGTQPVSCTESACKRKFENEQQYRQHHCEAHAEVQRFVRCDVRKCVKLLTEEERADHKMWHTG